MLQDAACFDKKSKTYYILVKTGHAEYSMKHANGFYALFFFWQVNNYKLIYVSNLLLLSPSGLRDWHKSNHAWRLQYEY